MNNKRYECQQKMTKRQQTISKSQKGMLKMLRALAWT